MNPLLIAVAVATQGAVTVQERQVAPDQGETRITVKNEYFQMDLVPLGAQAVSFQTRYSDRPWLWKGASGIRDGGHLFMDNFLGQPSPGGELCFIKHEYRVLERGPQRVTIAFHATTKQRLRLEKTFRFEAGSPVVRVKLALINRSPDLIVRGLWPGMHLHVAGRKQDARYFRPYPRGVLATGWDAARKKNVGQDYLRTPFAGWTAALHPEQQEGLVWLMDYNWLRWLYNCHPYGTVEWFYDDVPLPPKQRWETEYAMVLVKGFANVAHASPAVIAGMTMEPKQAFDLVQPNQPRQPPRLEITHVLSRSLRGPLKNVKLAARLHEVDNKRTHPLPLLQVGQLTWEPTTVTHRLAVDTDIRLACAVTLTGQDAAGQPVTESYEYYWPGAGGEKFNLVAGKRQATYFRKPPRKRKVFHKPEGLRYALNMPPRALELRGPGYRKLRVMGAAAKGGIRELIGSYFSCDWSGSRCSVVPTSFREAYGYDLFVLNGVSAPSLTDFGLESIADTVRAGGGLLVIGGFYAFGPGEYADTSLAAMLPVRLHTAACDLERLGSGVPVRVADQARCLKGRPWKSRPLCFWRHRLTPKPEAWIELTAGGKPLVVCGTYGKGRVAIVASGALGDPKPGQTPFWEDPAWPDMLGRIIRWLVFAKAP